MKNSNLAEQKLILFQKIMDIQNEKKLKQIVFFVDRFIKKPKDQAEISFEEWNELFMTKKDPDEFIPEYNMTLGDYRKKIYEAEISKSMPISDFLAKLEKYV